MNRIFSQALDFSFLPASMRRKSPVRGITVFGAAVGIAVALGALVFLSQQHHRALRDAERELQKLAALLAAQVDQSFQSLDLVQGGVIDAARDLGSAAPEAFRQRMSGWDVHTLLKEKIGGLPHIDAITLIDAQGKLINFSRYWPIPDVDVSDRDYFKVLSTTPGLTSTISEPVLNRGTGTWTIYHARKLEGPKGELAGLVLGAIRLDFFEQLFRKAGLGDESSVGLFRRDGILLARYPHAGPIIGRSFAGQKIFRQVLATEEEGAVQDKALIDGKDLLVAARALSHYPLAVTVAKPVDAALAIWSKDARYLVALVALVELVIVSAVLLAVRRLRNEELTAQAQAAQLAADSARALAQAEIATSHERERAAHALAAQYETVRRHEEELRLQNFRFEAALSNMSQGLAMFDGEHRLVVCNARYAEVYGLPPELVKPGTTQRDILENRVARGIFPGSDGEEYVRARIASAQRGLPSDAVVELRDGRAIAVSHRPMPGGGWVATHEDITARRQAEAQIAHMAHHDALTDLPNRVLFRKRMENALLRVGRGEEFAVLCLDVDHFKAVNDTLGHPVGDLLLRAVADRLRTCIRAGDTVARLGGDEFAILQGTGAQPQGASELARRAIEAVSAPYHVDGHDIVVGTSVGVALAPADASDPDQLLKNADLALYRAKAEGRGRYRFFEREMDARMQARRILEMDLRKALVAGEFELHFQPLMHVEAGSVSGFEALVRWKHPERGMVSPNDFIPLAEDIGLIVPLGDWVLREACAQAAQWPNNIKVAVNLSPAQFKSRTLVATVVGALAQSGLPASRLELEITESVLLQDDESNLSTLHQLRSLGVRISLDDFGTGYSSLSYLRSFPFDKIKIDQSFVRELSSRSDSAAIVRAVASLGRTLGMATTAEGVETLEQLERLRSEGCTEVQGYLFSRPKPASEIGHFLRGCGSFAPARARLAG